MLDAEIRLEGALKTLETNFASLRTGRVTPVLLDAVRVLYHGSPTPLNKLATIMTDGRALVVRPFDPGDTHAITEAIGQSPIGLTAQSTKTVIRVPVPSLSAERLVELSRAARVLAEDQRVAMRNVRRDALRAANELALPEDGARILRDELETLVKGWTLRVDQALEAKTHDISGVDDRFEFQDSKRRKARPDAPWTRPEREYPDGGCCI